MTSAAAVIGCSSWSLQLQWCFFFGVFPFLNQGPKARGCQILHSTLQRLLRLDLTLIQLQKEAEDNVSGAEEVRQSIRAVFLPQQLLACPLCASALSEGRFPCLPRENTHKSTQTVENRAHTTKMQLKLDAFIVSVTKELYLKCDFVGFFSFDCIYKCCRAGHKHFFLILNSLIQSLQRFCRGYSRN